MSPAASNAHPKAHMAVAIMSWSRFISSVWLYLLCPLGKKSKLSKPKASVFSWDSLDLCEHASKEVKFPCFCAHPCSSVGHIFPLIAQIYTEPRGSFIRQLRRTRSDRSNECEIRTWETIIINYLLGELLLLSYLLSVLSSTSPFIKQLGQLERQLKSIIYSENCCYCLICCRYCLQHIPRIRANPWDPWEVMFVG